MMPRGRVSWLAVLLGMAGVAACDGRVSPNAATQGTEGDEAGAQPDTAPPSVQAGGPGMTNCGPGGSGSESCAVSAAIPGGPFMRDDDNGMVSTESAGQATLSSYRLDRYEVTVGRFRQFVSATAAGWLPASGSGKHVHLNGGQGLVNSADTSGTSYEAGWDNSWDVNFATSASGWDSNLSCNGLTTWTPSPGTDENRPINCVDWYEAYAFCIWDGGFLPSDAEWNYAASGGSEQRNFPWSSPATMSDIDCSYANYGGGSSGLAMFCTASGTNDVGSESPKGDGKWGQSDLGGNVWEWVLDYFGNSGTCVDCANTTTSPPDSANGRMNRGGGLGAGFSLEVNTINSSPASDRDIEQGFRCARAP